jgi:hypothetical protein
VNSTNAYESAVFLYCHVAAAAAAGSLKLASKMLACSTAVTAKLGQAAISDMGAEAYDLQLHFRIALYQVTPLYCSCTVHGSSICSASSTPQVILPGREPQVSACQLLRATASVARPPALGYLLILCCCCSCPCHVPRTMPRIWSLWLGAWRSTQGWGMSTCSSCTSGPASPQTREWLLMRT